MRTPFFAGIETLERRDTPSAGLHALVTQAHRIVPLVGSGRGTVTSLSLTPPVAVSANVTGNASKVGPFQGTVSATGVGTSQKAVGTVVLRNAAGDEVDMVLTGSFKPGKAGSGKTNGTFRFVITGGTGLATGATGMGTMTGSVNQFTGAFQFTFNGKMRV